MKHLSGRDAPLFACAPWATPAALALALAIALACAGCGKTDAAHAAPHARTAPKAVATAAADKPADGLPAPHCPVTPDAALPGPDVVGLKLGMRAQDALNFVRCRNPDVFVSFEDRWMQNLNSYGIKLGHQMFEARAGDTSACSYRSMSEREKCGVGNRVWTHLAESITVATPGVPGQERVLGIWRTQHFKPAAMPPVETLMQALVAKYGAAQTTIKSGDGWTRMAWVADAQGTALQPHTQMFSQCSRINARANEAQSWSEGCGLAITALIGSPRDNSLLASEMSVGMVHQQKLYEFGRTLQADLLALDQMRKHKELERAQASGADVKL